MTSLRTAYHMYHWDENGRHSGRGAIDCARLPLQIPHTAEGFNTLHATLGQHQADPGQIAVALETSRGLLVHDLLQRGSPNG